MAALQSPFYGEQMNLYMLCQKIDKVEFPKLDPNIYSKELIGLVDACLASDPNDRPDAQYVLNVANTMYQRLRAQAQATQEQSSSSASPAARPEF